MILAFFGILLLGMGILNHYFFKTYAHDYGNYNFAFWDYSHFRVSPLTSFRGNFLQDHFSFTLMYFTPIYWLLNWLTKTYTLIIIQYSLILVGAWYSYKLIHLKSNNLWLGIGVLLYYFLLLGRYTAITCDVNLAIMSSCFIPVFIYYFEIKKYIVSFIILILSLFSRENIPIWFIFIFLVLIIQHRKEKKAVLFCTLGIVISIIYFILLFKLFIPSIESPGITYSLFNYSALGTTPSDALLHIVKHPIESCKLLFVNHLGNPQYNGVKMEFYWVYIISGGFVLLLRPQYLIWFIPIIAQKVLNDSPTRWGIASYYSIEIVTLLPLSVFLVLSSLKSRLIQNSLTLITCIATISMTIYKMDQKHNQVPWTLNPSKVKVYDKRFYEAPFDIKKVNTLLKHIPTQAKVSASNNILPHISQRQFIYFFPIVNDAEYIVFSVLSDNYIFSHYVNEKNRNKYFEDPKWKIIDIEFPVFLFKYDDSSTSNEYTEYWNSIDTLLCDYEKNDTIKRHILFSNNEKADTILLLTNDRSRSGNCSMKLSPEHQFSSTIILDDLKDISYLNISVWYYCNENEKANIIANLKNGYRFHNNENDTIESSGWKKLTLDFWIPQSKTNEQSCSINLWNTGISPIYFDDLQIIKRHHY